MGGESEEERCRAHCRASAERRGIDGARRGAGGREEARFRESSERRAVSGYLKINLKKD